MSATRTRWYPAQEEVQDYAATLATEALGDAVSLDSRGRKASVDLLLCSLLRRLGLDPAEVTVALRGAVHGEAAGTPKPLVAAVEARILAGRHASADTLRGHVLSAVRAVAPGVQVTLHANPDGVGGPGRPRRRTRPRTPPETGLFGAIAAAMA